MRKLSSLLDETIMEKCLLKGNCRFKTLVGNFCKKSPEKGELCNQMSSITAHYDSSGRLIIRWVDGDKLLDLASQFYGNDNDDDNSHEFEVDEYGESNDRS